MNRLYDYIKEQWKGFYSHAMIVTYKYDIESEIKETIELLGNEFSLDEYVQFFESMEMYYSEDSDRNEQQKQDIIDAKNMDIKSYVIECYNNFKSSNK